MSLAGVPHPGGDRHISTLYLVTWGWAKNSSKGTLNCKSRSSGERLHRDAKTGKQVMEEAIKERGFLSGFLRFENVGNC